MSRFAAWPWHLASAFVVVSAVGIIVVIVALRRRQEVTLCRLAVTPGLRLWCGRRHRQHRHHRCIACKIPIQSPVQSLVVTVYRFLSESHTDSYWSPYRFPRTFKKLLGSFAGRTVVIVNILIIIRFPISVACNIEVLTSFK